MRSEQIPMLVRLAACPSPSLPGPVRPVPDNSGSKGLMMLNISYFASQFARIEYASMPTLDKRHFQYRTEKVHYKTTRCLATQQKREN